MTLSGRCAKYTRFLSQGETERISAPSMLTHNSCERLVGIQLESELVRIPMAMYTKIRLGNLGTDGTFPDLTREGRNWTNPRKRACRERKQRATCVAESPMTFVPSHPPILLAFHFRTRVALTIRKALFARAGLFHAEVHRFSES